MGAGKIPQRIEQAVITGIVIALTEEVGTLTEKKVAKGGIARLSEKVWLVNSGAGAENAGRAAELLVKQGANRLISWGCAAGLVKGLQPGTLVLADCCIAADKTVFETDKPWREYILTLFAGQAPAVKSLAESDTVISLSEDKMKLAHATQAAALDMESASVARVAKANGIPFVAVRAIADPHDMNLPRAVSVAVDEQGQVNLGKLLAYLVAHPYELPALIRLGRHFKAAKLTLKRVAQAIDKLADFESKAA